MSTPQQLAQEWSDLSPEEQARRVETVTPCPRPGYMGRFREPLWIGDVRATTHLQNYEAFREYGGPSGFSGIGTAVIDSRTGDVLAREAFRFDALQAQERIEAARKHPDDAAREAAERLAERNEARHGMQAPADEGDA